MKETKQQHYADCAHQWERNTIKYIYWNHWAGERAIKERGEKKKYEKFIQQVGTKKTKNSVEI